MYNPATGAHLVASEPGPLLWCHMLFDISCVQLLPDPVLGPMAVAVPSLFAVHMAIIGDVAARKPEMYLTECLRCNKRKAVMQMAAYNKHVLRT